MATDAVMSLNALNTILPQKRMLKMMSLQVQLVDQVALHTERKTRVCQSSCTSHKKKDTCFIYNEKRPSDTNNYRGGIGRCTDEQVGVKVLAKFEIYLKDNKHKFYSAAFCLQALLSGESHDIYAAEIYCHQSCCLKFTISTEYKSKNDSLEDDTLLYEKEILVDFYSNITNNILHHKSAFPLNDILLDITSIGMEYGREIPPITNTKELKRKLISQFPEELSFFPNGKYVIVHACDINPCEYSVATLKGHGLRDNDLMLAFANMIKRIHKT